MIDSTSSTPVLLGSKIVGDAVPIGSVGAITATTVKGWAYAGGLTGDSATVRLDIDGVAGSLTVANISRPDLIPVVGGSGDFVFVITLPKLLAGTHTLDIWVIDPNTLSEILGSTAFVSVLTVEQVKRVTLVSIAEKIDTTTSMGRFFWCFSSRNSSAFPIQLSLWRGSPPCSPLPESPP